MTEIEDTIFYRFCNGRIRREYRMIKGFVLHYDVWRMIGEKLAK